MVWGVYQNKFVANKYYSSFGRDQIFFSIEKNCNPIQSRETQRLRVKQVTHLNASEASMKIMQGNNEQEKSFNIFS